MFIQRITSPVYDVEFKSKKYPVRDVYVALCGDQMVATKEFQSVLEENFGQAPEYEAETLDSVICATVDTTEALINLENIIYGTM